jgi:Ran GTPase-activating protein (RanGAP) involved in mRNA processing and transport
MIKKIPNLNQLTIVDTPYTREGALAFYVSNSPDFEELLENTSKTVSSIVIGSIGLNNISIGVFSKFKLKSLELTDFTFTAELADYLKNSTLTYLDLGDCIISNSLSNTSIHNSRSSTCFPSD